MPFTPLHLGPGVVFKFVARDRFSFMLFGFSQVCIDLEPLIRIYSGSQQVHGFPHTLLGASLLGLVVVPIGKLLSEFTFRLSRIVVDVDRQLIPTHISWAAATVGTFVGVWSHVLLDAIMHPDVRSWAPWSDDNPLLGIVSIESLHLICLVTAAFGFTYAVLWYMRAKRELHAA